MGKVLDIDCLLVQHEDVPGHAVGGLLELAQVDGLALVHLLPRAGEEDEEKEQEGCLWLKHFELKLLCVGPKTWSWLSLPPRFLRTSLEDG